MKDWAFLTVFGLMVAIFIANTYREEDRFESWVLRVSQALGERDKRMFEMNNRLQTLEEQRDIERRVTALEKAIRTFCVGTKTEMCGTLEVVK